MSKTAGLISAVLFYL